MENIQDPEQRKTQHNDINPWYKALCIVAMVTLLAIGYSVISIQRDIHAVAYRLDAKTGVLARVEGIETQANAASRNLVSITANVASATADWKKEIGDEESVVNTAVPTLVQQAVSISNSATATLGATNELLATTKEQATHVGPLLDSLKASSDSIPPTITKLQTTIDVSSQTMADVDSVVRSSDVKDSIKHFNDTVNNVSAMTADANAKFHEFLYPPPCKNWKCKLVIGYNIISGAGKLVEPVYWGSQLIQNIKP